MKWMKIPTDLLTRPGLAQLYKKHDGSAYVLAWLELVGLACRLGQDGRLCTPSGEGLDTAALARGMGETAFFTEAAVRTFIGAKLAYRDEQQILCIREWHTYV